MTLPNPRLASTLYGRFGIPPVTGATNTAINGEQQVETANRSMQNFGFPFIAYTGNPYFTRPLDVPYGNGVGRDFYRTSNYPYNWAPTGGYERNPYGSPFKDDPGNIPDDPLKGGFGRGARGLPYSYRGSYGYPYYKYRYGRYPFRRYFYDGYPYVVYPYDYLYGYPYLYEYPYISECNPYSDCPGDPEGCRNCVFRRGGGERCSRIVCGY